MKAVIVSNLAVVMAKKRVRTVEELYVQTGISRAALSRLYYGRGEGVHFSTLDGLCRYLGCDVGDLLHVQADLPATAQP